MSTQKKGWRNNYHPRTSWLEVIGKDLKFAWADFRKLLKNGGQLKSIVVYPDFPSKKTTIFKIANLLGYRLTNKAISNPDLVIYFEDITHGDTSRIREIYKERIINVDCDDISKQKVDRIHNEVFGYNTFIDPTKYSGIAVQKSDTNALHDGQIVHCPLPAGKEGSVYQLLIDNQFNDELVVDLRVPVIGAEIPCVYKKYKKMEVRFTNEVSYSTFHETLDVLSASEQEAVLSFARAMNVQFCEFDLLRHSDGRIFIIDVNKTPYGPPFRLDKPDEALDRLVSSFKRAFIK